MIKVGPYPGQPGRHRVTIYFRWPDGATYRERVRSPVEGKEASKRWAQAREASLLRAGPTPKAPPKACPLFRDFAPDAIRVPGSKISGEKSRAYTLKNHLLPAFGALRLDEITQERIEAWRLKNAAVMSRASQNKLSMQMSKILRKGEEYGYLAKAPKIGLVKNGKTTPRYYDTDRMSGILLRAAPKTRAAILLGAHAGLRRGEILALRWADVDLSRGQLTVRHSTYRGVTDSPKSGADRIVSVSQALRVALEALPREGAHVIWHRGGPIGETLLRAWVKEAAGEYGIHVLRHTFCSTLASKGAPVRSIQELAGHADLKTTLRYMHLAPGAGAKAIALLDE